MTSEWRQDVAGPGRFAGWREAGVDPTKPSIARVYDYWLGGTHNLVADRELGRRMETLDPRIPAACKANRAFLGRAVQYLVRDAGIRQFLDVGTGTCASYCVPFKRLCGLGFGGAFAAGLFGLGREGDGPAADRAAAGGQLPGGVDPGVHGGAGYADAVGYLPRGELAVGEQGGGGDVVVVAEVGG